ncbi:VOC family protein [Alkalihalobacillus hwajinpoensis]|uniref:VOC family protein n=1 Tax=Guptibacillus hwajinpoensis TaxID=208199 RepID=UPI0018833075|nr:VOC family protein [Pseudalkalibacillus hwajinpoensis]MBF0708735.1 VOC family protein [Pseudalkalibacillus hwajinpoensis]
MGIQKLEHVGVQVRNIEASKGFYQGIIGLELLDEFDHPDGDKKLAFLGLNGQILVELIEGYNPDLPAEGKVHHIAFKVENIEQERTRLHDLGVTFIDEEINTLPNGAKYLFFAGPDGEWLEFFESTTY